MALISKTRDPQASAEDWIPPLENGDRLTREEFERRWDLHPEIKKAELIDGQVYLTVTVSRQHSKRHAQMATWLGVYESGRAGIESLNDTTVHLEDDDLQPDVLLRKTEEGTSQVADDDCIVGPPELAVEIAASRAAYDLHQKLDLYQRAGVQEYIVWQVYERRIDWWQLRAGVYAAMKADKTGVVESKVFPGLRLNANAMLDGDMATVLAELHSAPPA